MFETFYISHSKYVNSVNMVVFNNICQDATMTGRKETRSNVCLLSIASIAGNGVIANHGLSLVNYIHYLALFVLNTT